MQRLVTKYKCISCKTNEIIMDEQSPDTNSRATKYLDNWWSGGAVFKMTIGYWSKHDGDMFIGAICDDCIAKHQEDDVLNYLGSYFPEDNLIRYVAEKIKFNSGIPNITDIINHSEFKNIVKGGKAIIPSLIANMDKEPWVCCLLLAELLNFDPAKPEHAGQIHEIKNDWKEWLKVNGWDMCFQTSK